MTSNEVKTYKTNVKLKINNIHTGQIEKSNISSYKCLRCQEIEV